MVIFLNSIPLQAVDDPVEDRTGMRHEPMSRSFVTLAILGALLATATSLGITAFAGWQRGGLPVERVINVTVSCIAVLFVHLLPIGWRQSGVLGRVCEFSLWWIGIAVVLYGQVTFLVVSQRHAGNVRAAKLQMVAALPTVNSPPDHTRTEIARDVMKTTAELARVEAGRCDGECSMRASRRGGLMSRIAELNVESDEARRSEAEHDRRIAQPDREGAQHAALRADPVALIIASWLPISESLFDLIVAVACAVVLEGAAIGGWLLVSATSRRPRSLDDDRTAAVSGRGTVVVNADAILFRSEIEMTDDTALTAESEATAAAQDATTRANDISAVTSEDERLLQTIRQAALSGELIPAQESIRKLLRCRQPKAGRLNRLYHERFGCVQNRRAA
jgi:hypothetical protein